MPVYSIQATTHPQTLVTWNIAHGYNTTVSLSGGVTLAVQNQTFGYADMICRLYFQGDTTESLPSVTVNEIVYHYDGSSYVYDHVNTNSRSGAYNNTYNVTSYLLSGNESMITGSYDQTTNYTDATLFSSSTSLDDMARIAREYFDNYEPYGQGTATITIKKPGQTLNFASRLLSKTIREYISGNATISMNVPVIVHDFPVQAFTTDYVFEKAIASYEIQTANALITISQTNADPYAKRRFMQLSSDRSFSATYKLNISGCSVSNKVSEVQQRQLKIYAYDERNSGTNYTYNTKASVIEVEDANIVSASNSKYVQSSVETEITSLELEAGIYFIQSSVQRQGDSYIKYGYLKDKTNNVRLAAERNSATYGYSTIVLTDLISVDSTITLSAYGYFYSGLVYAGISCVKLTGNIKHRTFAGTTSTSLSSVYSLSVSAGKYIVVSEIEFDTTSGTDIYSQVSYGGNVFVSDSGCDTTFDTPILHSVGYITVTSDGQLVVSVKTGTSGISISGYIKALKVA